MATLLKCPRCGWIGEAYDSQIAGLQSLVCSRCGWHGYSNKTPYLTTKLPLINIDRYLVRRRP